MDGVWLLLCKRAASRGEAKCGRRGTNKRLRLPTMEKGEIGTVEDGKGKKGGKARGKGR